MSKTIVFCADGTWNGPDVDEDKDGVPDNTNVLKLFHTLDGADSLDTFRLENEQERSLVVNGVAVQVAKYIHGVGDSKNKLVSLLGGAFGAGVIARIVRGYTFISRNYQPGDKIVVVGFSRGAYTVRALAGLIAAKGLLNPAVINLEDREKAYRAGAATWHEYRDQAPNHTNFLAHLVEMAACLPGFLSQKLPANSWISDVPIEAVAVRDTVGALGIPEYKKDGTGRDDVFEFTDTKLSTKVAHAFHAVSVDDQRKDFTPTLWDPDPRITQVLFPGAHADVGGGYPASNGESDLSDIALSWMIQNLRTLGVRFQNVPALKPNPTGPAHEPWLKAPWGVMPKAARALPASAQFKVHQAVLDRLGKKVNPDPSSGLTTYQPTNLAQLILQNGQLASPPAVPY